MLLIIGIMIVSNSLKTDSEGFMYNTFTRIPQEASVKELQNFERQLHRALDRAAAEPKVSKLKETIWQRKMYCLVRNLARLNE